MSATTKRLAPIFACVLLALVALGSIATATDTDKRLLDRSRLEISTGTAAITTTAAVWTSWTALLTIAPQADHAMYDCVVVFDLAKTTTGFATTHTSETITFSVARAVDGTNYRTANNLATATLSGTNAAGLSIELNLGPINPTEAAKIMIKLSAEVADNTSIPYVVYYRAGARAVFTPAT